ncbi:MAG: PTS sugar transporter subunit IIA [Lentisphaeria bacterium]|nr:PTS sugar transporter subunit IIA [Lentisphaeria bacterium]
MPEKMKNFYTYLLENNILCNTCNMNGTTLISKLMNILAGQCNSLDAEDAAKEVEKREALFSTVIAPGLAVPHARISSIDKPLVAMACCPDGIDFHGQNVKIIVLLLTPIAEPNLHLQLMAALAKDFSEENAISQVAKSATPSDVLTYFKNQEVVMVDYLTAKEVMRENVITLYDTDTLLQAINSFSSSPAEEFPVIDKNGNLKGIVSLTDLLRHCLPENMLWMEDLSSIYKMQPFAEMLKNACTTKISEIMNQDFITVSEDVPAVQLAKLFLTDGIRCLVVINKDGKLSGIVKLKEFCAKFFWE